MRFQLLEFAKISNTKHNNVRFDPLRISFQFLEYISSVLNKNQLRIYMNQ